MLQTYRSLICAVALLTAGSLQAQVSHSPENKKFLIEKGTGQVCGSCHGIAMRCDTVIDSHPGKGMLIEYHFGPDATPQAGPLAQDFRTAYGDTIYNPSPAGLHWPFYLNMMVNRRDQGLPWGSTFIFGTNDNQVQKESDLLVNQSSPVNLYMSSSYNPGTRQLSVNVELYYTANAATDSNYIQIAITEDSIISTQYDPVYYTPNNGFNPAFNHTNIFRDNINGFMGDLVTTTTQGSTVSRSYTYTMPTSYRNIACNPQHCKLTLYVTDKKAPSGMQSFTGKIMTAVRTNIYGHSPASVRELTDRQISVYPNPSNGLIQIQAEEEGSYSLEVSNVQGRTIYTAATTSREATLDLSAQPNGIYFVRILSEKGIFQTKFILAR